MAADRVDSARFRAMGTDVHVLVVGGEKGAAAAARRRIADLERRWSRFQPASELSMLNQAGGRPTIVSGETAGVVALAVDAWRATAGAFDPTVLTALQSLGYDRSFERIDTAGPGDAPSDTGPTPGCDGILADRATGLVMLPAGVSIDLGGIGKGHAADLVATELIDAGCDGVCINIGGDLRVEGVGTTGETWWVGIDDELSSGDAIGSLEIHRGGVATTTSRRRRWMRDGRVVHHVIDPRTGAPSESSLASVTVLAATAAWAEVIATAAFLAGPERAIEAVRALAGEALLLTSDGQVVLSDGFAAACA